MLSTSSWKYCHPLPMPQHLEPVGHLRDCSHLWRVVRCHGILIVLDAEVTPRSAVKTKPWNTQPSKAILGSWPGKNIDHKDIKHEEQTTLTRNKMMMFFRQLVCFTRLGTNSCPALTEKNITRLLPCSKWRSSDCVWSVNTDYLRYVFATTGVLAAVHAASSFKFSFWILPSSPYMEYIHTQYFPWFHMISKKSPLFPIINCLCIFKFKHTTPHISPQTLERVSEFITLIEHPNTSKPLLSGSEEKMHKSWWWPVLRQCPHILERKNRKTTCQVNNLFKRQPHSWCQLLVIVGYCWSSFPTNHHHDQRSTVGHRSTVFITDGYPLVNLAMENPT